MTWSRRNILEGGLAATLLAGLPKAAFAAKFSPSDWRTVANVIDDVATALDRATATLGKHGKPTKNDFVTAGYARSRFRQLSPKLRDTHVEAVQNVANPDAYLDMWQQFTNKGTQPLSPKQAEQLQAVWGVVLENVHDLITENRGALQEMGADLSEPALVKAMKTTVEVLNEQKGALMMLAKMPAPLRKSDIEALEKGAPSFQHMRQAMTAALKALDDFIPPDMP